MPIRRSGIKELRKNRKNKMRNMDIKTDLKKAVKSFLTTVNEKKTDEAKAQLTIIYKKIDKAAKRNLLHKNTAARRKSHLSKLINQAAS